MRGEFYSFYFNVGGILIPQALQTLSKLIPIQTKHSKEKKNQVVSYATWLQLYNLLTLGKSCIKKTLKSVKEKVCGPGLKAWTTGLCSPLFVIKIAAKLYHFAWGEKNQHWPWPQPEECSQKDTIRAYMVNGTQWHSAHKRAGDTHGGQNRAYFNTYNFCSLCFAT